MQLNVFVTVMVPAPIVVLGTVTVILVLLSAVCVAEIPLISTEVVPQKLVPVTVTVAPTAPLAASTVGVPREVTVNGDQPQIRRSSTPSPHR